MTDKFKMAKQCDQMNRKNRMAALASQASVQFNTYLYFKSLQESNDRDKCRQSASVMRISASGPYVMVKKYGIEGLLTVDGQVAYIESNPEKEEARVISKKGSGQQVLKVLKVFDSVNVEIKAAMVEFRRTVELALLL